MERVNLHQHLDVYKRQIYVVPDFKGLTMQKLVTVFVDALGQLFLSLIHIYYEQCESCKAFNRGNQEPYLGQ